MVFAAAAAVVSGCGSNPPADSVRITVPKGATLTAVAETLSAHEVVRGPKLFTLYARISGRQQEIQAGTYDLSAGMPIRTVLTALVSGREALDPVLIPEGLMLSEVAELVGAELGIPTDSFLAAASDPELRREHGVSSETLEGYLFPSTYYVRVGVTARELVQQMLNEFEARWNPEWNRMLDTLRFTRHEAVILASIIEAEVRYGPDRSLVSSVYHNRLRRGMRLQADPTVIYALGRRRRLYQKDYRYPSPYNTYLIDGLPPGPIGQPSEASLEAALFPTKTNYLFFVAQPDGKHVFSRTLREHNAAISRVRAIETERGPRR